jgi:hypothetical protein
MAGQFTINKSGIFMLMLQEFNLNKQIPWEFHVNDHSNSSNTNETIIVQDLLVQLGIIMNFYHQIFILDTGTIPMKNRNTIVYIQQRP